MGFLPKKRSERMKGKPKAFPQGSKVKKKEVVEGVTIIETLPMVAVGVVGFIETPKGLRALQTVRAEHIGEEFKRRLYKNWSGDREG